MFSLENSIKCHNCPIDFKLCMMIPITVRYDIGSVATLYSLPERPYVHSNHADFDTKKLYCIIYPIHLVFGIMIPRTTNGPFHLILELCFYACCDPC